MKKLNIKRQKDTQERKKKEAGRCSIVKERKS